MNDNQLDMIVNNTLLSETTDSILPLYATTNTLLPESVNSTLPLDSVNNDSFTPQPTNVPSFFGKDLFKIATKKILW